MLFRSTLSKLGIKTIEDLLFHFPIGYQDRTILKKIAELEPNQDFVVQGVIEKVSQTFVPRKMLLVKIKDNTGHLYLRFFYYFPGLRNVFKEGTSIQVSGSSRLGRYGLETVHPEYEIVKNDEFKPQILAKYPLTKGITHQKMRKLMSEAIELIKEDKIEVVNNGTFSVVQVRTATVIKRDGVEISRSFSRHVVAPDADISGESSQVQAICAAVHTQEVKDA